MAVPYTQCLMCNNPLRESVTRRKLTTLSIPSDDEAALEVLHAMLAVSMSHACTFVLSRHKNEAI